MTARTCRNASSFNQAFPESQGFYVDFPAYSSGQHAGMGAAKCNHLPLAARSVRRPLARNAPSAKEAACDIGCTGAVTCAPRRGDCMGDDGKHMQEHIFL